MTNLLIGYYTETNSTKEVCDYIESKLDAYTVSSQPLTDVTNIDKYDVVIVAAPVHGMKWHQSAYKFIETFRDDLNTKKVVFIALASMAYQGRNIWQKKVFKSLCKPSKIVMPLEAAIFGGLSGELPTIIRYLFGIPKDGKKDQRDWHMIDEWVLNLKNKL